MPPPGFEPESLPFYGVERFRKSRIFDISKGQYDSPDNAK